jgi:beta-glucosidase
MKKSPKPDSAAVRSAGKTKVSAYRNPKLAPERRTKDLLARMTLEEKAAQMICVWQQKAETLVDADGRFDQAKAVSATLGRAWTLAGWLN